MLPCDPSGVLGARTLCYDLAAARVVQNVAHAEPEHWMLVNDCNPNDTRHVLPRSDGWRSNGGMGTV
jgi:hypothetical protein